jgi:Zn-dependent protease with chaperone function
MRVGRNRAPKLVGRFEVRQLPGYALYLLTLFCQLLAAWVRGASVFLVLSFVGLFAPWSIPAAPLAWIAAVVPPAASLLCLFLAPLQWMMGYWWEMSEGGRAPVPDEREAFEDAIATIELEDLRFKRPRHWFVAEEAGYNASIFAHSMCVTRGLLESDEAAPAFISHEYPHLRLGDGRLLCALQFLVLWPMEKPKILPLRSLPGRALLWVGGGAAVEWFFEKAWQTYWRSREYASDHYTIRVGQGPVFARSLRAHSMPYEQPTRWMSFSVASHPYTKQRMARLEGQSEIRVAQLASSEAPALPDPAPAAPLLGSEVPTAPVPASPVAPLSDYDLLRERLGANYP